MIRFRFFSRRRNRPFVLGVPPLRCPPSCARPFQHIFQIRPFVRFFPLRHQGPLLVPPAFCRPPSMKSRASPLFTAFPFFFPAIMRCWTRTLPDFERAGFPFLFPEVICMHVSPLTTLLLSFFFGLKIKSEEKLSDLPPPR